MNETLVRANHERIRELNDTHRRAMPAGQVMFTSGIAAHPSDVLAKIVRTVASFDDFNEDNDPYGEHDCAMFEVAGHKCMFKIDYYDKDIKYGSEGSGCTPFFREVYSTRNSTRGTVNSSEREGQADREKYAAPFLPRGQPSCG